MKVNLFLNLLHLVTADIRNNKTLTYRLNNKYTDAKLSYYTDIDKNGAITLYFEIESNGFPSDPKE